MARRTFVSVFTLCALMAGFGLASSGASDAVAQTCEAPGTSCPALTPSNDVDNGLAALAVVSANDIWAVGNSGTYGGQRSTLAEHWNGSTWSIAPTPNGPNEVNWLLGADAVASNDVWAVGYSATNPPEQSFRRTLIEHWNGSAWSVIPSPNPTPPLSGGPVSNELYGVAAVSANDVWAVGHVRRLRRRPDPHRPLERHLLVDGPLAEPRASTAGCGASAPSPPTTSGPWGRTT